MPAPRVDFACRWHVAVRSVAVRILRNLVRPARLWTPGGRQRRTDTRKLDSGCASYCIHRAGGPGRARGWHGSVWTIDWDQQRTGACRLNGQAHARSTLWLAVTAIVAMAGGTANAHSTAYSILSGDTHRSKYSPS